MKTVQSKTDGVLAFVGSCNHYCAEQGKRQNADKTACKLCIGCVGGVGDVGGGEVGHWQAGGRAGGSYKCWGRARRELTSQMSSATTEVGFDPCALHHKDA